MSTPSTPQPSGASVTASLDVSIHLLQGILAAIPQTQPASEAVGLIAAALDKLIAVQGNPTTFGELEGLRLPKLW